MLKLENVSKVYYGKSHGNSSDDNNDNRVFLEHVVLNNLNQSIGEGALLFLKKVHYSHGSQFMRTSNLD